MYTIGNIRSFLILAFAITGCVSNSRCNPHAGIILLIKIYKPFGDLARLVCRRYRPGVLLVCLASAQAIAADEPAPRLFDSHGELEVEITAPIARISRLRPIDEYVPGTFKYTADSGEVVELDIGIRARGHYRRKPGICNFPPWRLNFRKKQVDGTIFQGQDKLKLVTHCRNDSEQYEQAVIAEYLTYRILNLLTDYSFRVRLLKVRYSEADDGRIQDGYAFLIEHSDELSRRLGLDAQEVEKIHASRLQGEHLSFVSVFQYMIGNTDFSPLTSTPGQSCCHNYELFGAEGGPYFSIPYDFDMAGLVDAPHAEPNPKLRLYSVKERLYRGYCISNERLPASLQLFRDNRAAIEELINTEPALTARKRGDMLGFIDQFYEEISNPKKVEKRLVKKCK